VGDHGVLEIVDRLQDDSDLILFAIRIATFVGILFGFRLMLAWIDFLKNMIIRATPTCIPGVSYLTEGAHQLLDCVLFLVIIPPTLALWTVSWAIAWIVFRPLIGIPIGLVAFSILGYYIYKGCSKPTDSEDDENQTEKDLEEERSSAFVSPK